MDKVLIVDDSIVSCCVIQNVLTTHNIEVFIAYSGVDAMTSATEHQPDLILLDVVLQGENGYDICRRLKSDLQTYEIPIVFLTSVSDESSMAKGFSCGCVDYLQKPFTAVELLSRVEAHIKTKQMRDQLKKVNAQLENMNRHLADMLREKEMWGKTDQLTKLYNRHYVTDMLPIWNSQLKSGSIFSMIMADIDFFKSINDTHGHFAGDFLLQSISPIINKCCGEDNVAVRWGGEEFLIITPDMELTSAVAIAEELRKQIAAYTFELGDISFTCTITLGVAQGESALALEKIISNADVALYEGKRNGRNCVVPSLESLLRRG